MANVDIMRGQRQESLPEIRTIAIEIEVIVVISFVSPVSPTGSGWTPGNHGQPEGVMPVLPVPDWGIANTGL
jgi:hypothetical protein